MEFDATGRGVTFGPFPRLETARLVLRPLTVGDAPFWLSHFSDPEIVELTAFAAPKDLAAAREELLTYAVRNFQASTGIRWGIVLKGQPDLIGPLGFDQWVKESGYHARVGYDLRKEYRRRGLMTEAMTAILDWGFDALRLNKVEALTDPRNVASMRLLEKLGFHRDGVLRENTYFEGRFQDDVCFSLLAREWHPQRSEATKR